MKEEVENGIRKLDTSSLSRFPSFIVAVKFLAWEAEYCFLTIRTHMREENRKLHVRHVYVCMCVRASVHYSILVGQSRERTTQAEDHDE